MAQAQLQKLDNSSVMAEEYCLASEKLIADAAGNAVTVSAGESFVIPRGFVGTWEVVEPTKKIYVVYEAGA